MPHLSIIPAAAVADPALTDAQLRILCALGTFTNSKGKGVWASVRTLAKACNMSSRSIQRAFAVLCDRGYLAKVERPGMTNLYEILLHQGVTPVSGGGDTPDGGGVTELCHPNDKKNDKKNDRRDEAKRVVAAIWSAYPKRDTPHLYPPALKAVEQCLADGASADRLILSASLYADDVRRKQTEPQFVKTIAKFFSDGLWAHYADTVRVHGRTRDEWARSGQDVAEFDRLAEVGG
jgi:hypothetical protein